MNTNYYEWTRAQHDDDNEHINTDEYTDQHAHIQIHWSHSRYPMSNSAHSETKYTVVAAEFNMKLTL